MALFTTAKKDTKKKAKAASPARAPRAVKDPQGRLSTMLGAPWLSEKALIGTENGVYVFAIPQEATKLDVSLAVEKVYKVAPRQVRVVNLPAKKINLRTRRGVGMRGARRKAYVYLKKGETLQFA